METKKAQLAAHVAAMTQELAQKSEEIRRYQAEQSVMLNRVRELVGHPGEIVNKAHLYDRLMETANPSSAQQTLQILVEYSRSMKDLLKEIHKLLPPRGNPRRMLNTYSLGSPPTDTKSQARWSLSRPPRLSLGLAKQPVHQGSKNPVENRIARRPQCRKGPGRLRFGGRELSVRRGHGIPNPRYRKERRLPSGPRHRIVGRPLLRMRCSHQRLTG